MKVKVIQKAYYGEKILEEGEIINFAGDKIPSWAVSLEAVKLGIVQLPEEVKDEFGNIINIQNAINTADQQIDKIKNIKVGELPEEEKEILIKKAQELGLKGVLESYKVSTLEQKIIEAEGTAE